jgi:hypothetical protein
MPAYRPTLSVRAFFAHTESKNSGPISTVAKNATLQKEQLVPKQNKFKSNMQKMHNANPQNFLVL